MKPNRQHRSSSIVRTAISAMLLMGLSSVSNAEVLNITDTTILYGTGINQGSTGTAKFNTGGSEWQVTSGSITGYFFDSHPDVVGHSQTVGGWVNGTFAGIINADGSITNPNIWPTASCREPCTQTPATWVRDIHASFGVGEFVASMQVGGAVSQKGSVLDHIVSYVAFVSTEDKGQSRNIWDMSYYTNAFSITIALDEIALADINKDGILGIGFSSVLGDFELGGFSMAANATWNPLIIPVDPPPIIIIPIDPPPIIIIPPTSNVPEPGSLALLGLGIFGLAATRRKPKAS